jgi:hypothetical protein
MKKICFLFILIFATLNLPAQTDKKKEIKQCDAQTARQYVEQQAIESKSTTESDKRINILIRVADYLWDKDNDSARKYFAEAFKLAHERFKEKGIKNTSTTKFYIQNEPDYRFEVIRAVSKRDGEWAKSLTDEVLKNFDEDENKSKRESNMQEQEIKEALFLGVSLVETNPNAAISIFRRVMNYPVTGTWYYIVYQIAAKNPALAEQIYAELIVKYSNSGVRDFLYLSAFPFGNARIFGLEKYRFGYTSPPVAVTNPNLQRQFIGTLLNQINSLTPETNKVSEYQKISDAGYALSALSELTPIINQNFPELKANLAVATATANGLIDEETRKNMEIGNNFKDNQGKTFAEKIKDLEEADEKGTLTDYEIVKLIIEVKKEDQLKALEPWLDKIKDKDVREKSINFFYFTSAKIAIKEKRLDDARKFADKVPQIEHRAVLYFDLADAKLKEPLTKFESLEILTEVYKTAEKAPDTVEKAQVFLGVAFIFEKIDRFNSIDTLSKAINTANKLENPNLFTEFITIKIVGEKFGVFAGYSVPGFDINKTFYQISLKDFQGAISQAEGFTDRYLRTLAILASVKDCEKNNQGKAVKK